MERAPQHRVGLARLVTRSVAAREVAVAPASAVDLLVSFRTPRMPSRMAAREDKEPPLAEPALEH